MSLWKLWVSLLWLTCNTDQLFEPRHVVNPFPFPHPFPLTFDSVFSGLFMEQGFIGREPHGGRCMHLITIGPYDFRNHRIMDRIVEMANKNIMDWISVGVFFFFFEKQEHFCTGRTFLGVCNCVSLKKQSRTSPNNSSLSQGSHEKLAEADLQKLQNSLLTPKYMIE